MSRLILFLVLLVLATPGRAESPLAWAKLPAMPDDFGFAGPFAGVSGGSLLVSGGANFPHGYPWEGGEKVYHDGIYVLDAPDGTWRKSGTRLPAGIGYGASVTLPSRDAVLCIGGNDGTGSTDSVYELVLTGGEVKIRQEIPALPVRATMGCAALLGDTVYYAGGESGGVTHRRFYQLDLGAPVLAWQELPWPEGAPGRILAVAGVRDGRFYLLSGCDLGSTAWDGRTYLTDAWSYDPAARSWRKLADLPRSVAAAPGPAMPMGAAHLLVPGGSNRAFVDAQRALRPETNGNGVDHPGFPRAILAYHTITDTWTETGEVPDPAPVTTTAVEWHGCLVIPTGEIKPGIRSPQVISATPVPRAQPSAWQN